jgi:hypothetical protein
LGKTLKSLDQPQHQVKAAILIQLNSMPQHQGKAAMLIQLNPMDAPVDWGQHFDSHTHLATTRSTQP